MCLSFLHCSKRKKKKSSTKISTIIPTTHQKREEEEEDSDSLSSLRADMNSFGIPSVNEKYYQEIGGVLIMKKMSSSSQNAIQTKEISIEIESPVKNRIKMARERLMTL
ncbi:unnamed protein product [Blepharisma stoltei]|uniref:Uncharacterized protein n=1 Tax=Blepharisma stoltei TaxID=1481888 RepID=A0AAU9KFP2_9CILI|nr:unnamed protein product [Blepharisma stoltei]